MIIKGTQGNDYNLIGTGEDDEIDGLGGDDSIVGLGGDDTIHGGDGSDAVYGGRGSDVLFGDAGDDVIGGEEGDDLIFGGDGDDRIHEGAGNDVIDGGDGSDTVTYDTMSPGLWTNLQDYRIAEISPGVFQVRDMRPGSPDGTDTIINVEFLQFVDRIVALGVPATGAVAIDDGGAGARENVTLSAVLATTTVGTVSYQWLRDGVPIDGATAADYTLTHEDLGCAISVVAGYVVKTGPDTGVFEQVTSNPTGPIEERNDAPVFLSGPSSSFAENGTGIVYAAIATDADGDPLAYALSGADAALFAIDAHGHVTFKAAPDFEAPADLDGDNIYEITVTVSDGISTVAQPVSITVTEVNEAPAVENAIGEQAATEDAPFSFVLPQSTFADADGDGLAFLATLADGNPLPAWLHFDGTNGTFAGTPTNDDVGALTLRVIAFDGRGGSVSTTFVLTVGNVNDAPSGEPTGVLPAGTEDVAYAIAASTLLAGFSDADGDALAIAAISASHGATVQSDGAGGFTVTPAADFHGTVTLTYSVTDGNGGTAEATRTIVFAAVNDAPTAAALDLGAIAEEGSLTITAAQLLAGVGDVDGPSAAITGLMIAAGGGTLVDNGDGSWTYTGAADDDTAVRFSYTATDGEHSVSATASLDLTPVQDAPVAASDVAAVVEYATVTGSVLTGAGADTDADDDPLAVTHVAGLPVAGASGTVVYGRYGALTLLADGRYSYVADNAEALAAGESGTDVFSYMVSDGQGGTATATLAITVHGTNAGTAGNDYLRGTSAAEVFSGGGGDDIINAAGGNDRLDGGAGFDVLIGGAGDDTYVLGAEDDTVIDTSGNDTIVTTVSRSLAAYAAIENLVLAGTAAINGTGNGLANVITGNSGANVLNGGGGADRLVGGAGDDTYVTDGGDTIVEAAGGGTDTVRTSVTLALGANLENLVLTGGAAINGTGNGHANVITGNKGANVLNGGAGNDTLYGGLGKDLLVGGSGRDMFIFNTKPSAGNVDVIKDFNVVDDAIRLENAVFTALSATGALSKSAFASNTSGLATDKFDRIVYETDTGKLFYDADGNGKGAAVQIATLSKNLALTYADFFVI